MEENILFKNDARAFLKLVDFIKCQEQLLEVLEINYNMSDINMFKNMHKNKMNNKCNLWGVDL